MKNAGDLPPDTSEGGRGASSLSLTAVLMGRGARFGGAASAPRGGGASAPTNSVPSDWKLPEWIKPDAHICYNSRSSGEKIEVVVEMVNTAKQEVEVTGVSVPGFLRVIPFSVIAAHPDLSFDGQLLGGRSCDNLRTFFSTHYIGPEKERLLWLGHVLRAGQV
ncbi:unnamed protein product [Effrenium voratum]|nr:unnamed protein product [Effrenium voratum]